MCGVRFIRKKNQWKTSLLAFKFPCLFLQLWALNLFATSLKDIHNLTFCTNVQGGTYTTVGQRISKGTMTCEIPRQALEVHYRHVDFDAIRPADSNFSSLPLGGARQINTVSVSNNGRDFGASQTHVLYNSTCMSCGGVGVVQRVSSWLFTISQFSLNNWHNCGFSAYEK